MSTHAGPPRDDEPAAPEPTYGERARTLLHLGRTGALATLARKPAGYPFASVMPYAIDADGSPLFLISTMAMHTQNLLADARASLLVTQTAGADDDLLALGRVTVIGDAGRVAEAGAPAVREAYLARHPNAAYWVDFGDFAFWRLAVASVYVVGGFAAMSWVDAEEYRQARPDPLSEAAGGIIDHMNRDHPDALLLYARAFAGAEADEAVMVAVDRLGFKLRLTDPTRRWSVRIAFPRPVSTAAESRTVLIEMLQAARASKAS